MRSLSDTLARLAKLRALTGEVPVSGHRLADLVGFGSNPGALAAKIHLPASLQPNCPLVVVLHGCTQTAASYDAGSGWSQLADEYGVALLFPEQSRANNANGCFNWFATADIGRDQGETASIRQMIETMTTRHAIDGNRIFITGLSAGGAMANVLLATHPELFAGGAIIAGLPYATAASVPEAFDRMRGHGLPRTDDLQARLRRASAHDGPWPTVSVWHGTQDATVAHANALAVIDQWRGVHGLDAKPDVTETVDGHLRQAWSDGRGYSPVELYSIAGMGHGTPLDVTTGYGRSGPFMLDVGMSSTLHIARSWGLTPSFERTADRRGDTPAARAVRDDARPAAGSAPMPGIQKTIEDALRAAGLMK